MDEKKDSNPSRRWCFTYNNPENPPIYDEAVHKYLVYQLEKGENKGTEHYQGYVHFKKPKRLSACVKWLPGAHFESARGSEAQCRAYCTKTETRVPDTTFHEYGAITLGQGERTDLSTIQTLLKDGIEEVDLLERYPAQFVRYHKAFTYIRNLYARKNQKLRSVVGFLLYGPTGSGKSYRVWQRESFSPAKLFAPDLSKGTLWWDGYDGQGAILLDDYNGQVDVTTLLRLLDGYPLSLPIKGSFTVAAYTTVYFTSNKKAQDWYPQASTEHLDALTRRLKFIYVASQSSTIIWDSIN